ncbi:hypothetical protein TSUD_294640, partial [Trifolium subterraneum]
MGGSDGESFSDGESTEVPLNNEMGVNDMLGSPQLQAGKDIQQATMDCICTNLRNLVKVVQKQGKIMEEHALNVKRISSVLGQTIDKIRDNVTRTDEMVGMCSELLRKVDNIENMFTKSPPSNTNKSHTNCTPVHYSEDVHASKDDISNIVLFISSDEDEDQNIPKRTRTQVETVDPYKTSGSAGKKSIAKTCSGGKKGTKSTERARTESKMKQKITNSDVECMVGRKLSFVRSPNFNTLKVPKTEKMIDLCPPKDLTTKLNQAASLCSNFNGVNNPGTLLSKFIKTKFPLSPEMNLTTEQAHISAYIFHPFNNPEEPLFKVGDFEGLRKDFQSMCPYVTVDERIVHMMAMTINWTQKHMSSPTKWAL